MRRFYQRSMAQGIIYIGEEERLSAGKNRLDSATENSIHFLRGSTLSLANSIRCRVCIELFSSSQAAQRQSIEKIKANDITLVFRKAV